MLQGRLEEGDGLKGNEMAILIHGVNDDDAIDLHLRLAGSGTSVCVEAFTGSDWVPLLHFQEEDEHNVRVFRMKNAQNPALCMLPFDPDGQLVLSN